MGTLSKPYIYIYIILDGLPGFARIPKRKINKKF